MMRRTSEELDRWLRAEAEGRRVDADRACRRTFLGLPAVALPAGLSRRIVTAVIAALPRRRDPFSRPAVRLAVAAGLLLAAGVSLLIPGALVGAGERLRVGDFIDFLQGMLGAVSSLATSMPGLWNQAASFARLGSGAFASPVFLLLFTGLAGVALASFRLLSELTLRQKGLSHVDAI